MCLSVAMAIQFGCAGAKRAVVVPPPSPGATSPQAAIPNHTGRPRVGVAFGGGSARGLAHVGVIRWFEEHRIPIDLVAGTSMGGLVGGTYATGLDARELTDLLSGLDWDDLFGSSTFAYKNIRRKADARAFPSRIEFGLKRGIVAPTALNSGAQVDLLLARIAAPYFGLAAFDDLPTPFRAVAVDLARSEEVVLDRGSLADAMRATMSLPLIFPPVEIDGRIFVDGGVLNNVPADVVRGMGAAQVIAVDVGDTGPLRNIDETLLGVAGAAVGTMMRVSTRRALEAADIVIHVPMPADESRAWRRARALADEGYKAAEAMRDRLLPLALSSADYETWRSARQARRHKTLPNPAFVRVEGFADADARRLAGVARRHVNVPLDAAALEDDLRILSGLDRYESIVWRLVEQGAATGLLIRGRPKAYAPPFLMLGVSFANTTESDFKASATARYLAYGLGPSASELRLDGTVGSHPGVGAEYYVPWRATPFFVAPYARLATSTFDVIVDEALYARYGETFKHVGANVGVNLGNRSDVRLGAYVGSTGARVKIGPPIFPSVDGTEATAELTWRFDGQDSAVIPSRGLLAMARLSRVLESPSVVVAGEQLEHGDRVTQLSLAANRFWSLGHAQRIFVAAGTGATAGGDPLPHDTFLLGAPMRLGAYRTGELYGKHFYLLSFGMFRQVARMPDFLGGPIFAGAWLENGDAFSEWNQARLRTNVSAGLVMDTLIGPVSFGGSAGFDGRWRAFVGIGRLFRQP